MKRKISIVSIAIAIVFSSFAGLNTIVAEAGSSNLSAITNAEIGSVIDKLGPAIEVHEQFDTPRNMILIDENNDVVGEIHADGYAVSYTYSNGELYSIVDTVGNKTELDRSSG